MIGRTELRAVSDETTEAVTNGREDGYERLRRQLTTVNKRLRVTRRKTLRDEPIGHHKTLREFGGRSLQLEEKVGSRGKFREFEGRSLYLEGKLGGLREGITSSLDLEGKLGV